ncbi:MAG: pseudouridine-5'-phosphate glycosidase, partial [Mycobacterium sp.]|nr:pseudouridine-5'-phosphate glycosidase [Mycobacterium sp.]
MRIHPEVSDALATGRPVVALESTIISHGLPRPDNLRVARETEEAVRSGGAVPATIAIIGGEPHLGLDDAAMR